MPSLFSGVQPPTVAMTSDGGLSVTLGTYRVLEQSPVTVELTEHGERTAHQLGYVESARDETALRGFAELAVGDISLKVVDDWVVTGTELRLSRQVEVSGTASAAAGFATGVFLHAGVGDDWPGVTPFAPGVSYGDGEPVGPGFLGGRAGRRGGVESILVREDRLAAPVFGYRGGDGGWVAVLHEHPDAGTIAADAGLEAGGETLIDERLGFASLGGSYDQKGLRLGACYPGSEGEYTYSSGGLPLTQERQWRRRYHPLVDGALQRYDLVFRFGGSESVPDFYRQVWRWAYARLAPEVTAVDPEVVVTACTKVLAEQVVTLGDRAGVPLEADAVTADATGLETQAVMGFVGANTDAAYLLLRATDETDRAAGERIMDSFAGLEMLPPAAEGFDTVTGRPATYRSIEGRPAVYARSVAEGCLAAVQAWGWERNQGRDHPHWLEWARAAGDWLVSQQAADGASPRAWLAGSAETLDSSTTASHVGVSFLVALSRATGDNRYLQAAIRGAEFCWRNGGHEGSFAGGTLDNPNVIDKESAVLALEGFLDLYEFTGESRWLERAEVAGTVAESWTYLWNVPMPADADDAALHFKRGVSTIGYQLIATGVSMTDGFLAVNAAAFARLFQHTGDGHYLDFARLVTHGTKTMLALPGATWDLRGPGWQQEHWCFAVRRGFGLNRRWLPWVPVAHVKGILRLRELPSAITEAVLGLSPRDSDSSVSAGGLALPARSDYAS